MIPFLASLVRFSRKHTEVSLSFILFFFSLTLRAQLAQTERYEREHKSGQHEYILVSMNENGIALVRDLEKTSGGKREWEVIMVDTMLKETWTPKIEIDERMGILGYDYRDGNVYFVFRQAEAPMDGLLLTEVLVNNKTTKQHKVKPQINVQFTHFSVLKNKAIFGGYINHEPALLLYDMGSEALKVVPGIFPPNTQLLDVRANANETFNVLLAERQSNSIRSLVARTYDADGVMLVEDVIPIEDGKTVVDALTSSLIHDEILVTGTWAVRSSKAAAGIFSVLLDPFRDQKINYYDFAELNHFLDYMKPRRAARIKAKADWRRRAGKAPDFKAHLNPIRIEENKTGFTLLAEVFDPPASYYNSRYNSPYGYNSYPYNTSPYYGSPYGYGATPYRYNNPYGYSPFGYNPYAPYGSTSTLADTRIIHSTLISFDRDGKMESDLALKFPEIKLSTKEQVSDFVRIDNRTILACKIEKEILVRIDEPDGTFKVEKVTPALKNNSETIRSEQQESSSIRFWYGHTFYVYGYQTLRDDEAKKTRDVFYLNKISAE